MPPTADTSRLHSPWQICYSARQRNPSHPLFQGTCLVLHAYRLLYDDSPHAPPPLWEWEQPSIDRLVWNARAFGRQVVQRYFASFDALDHENTRIWEQHFRPKPAYEHLETWQEWLTEYRALIVDVQAIAETHMATGGALPQDAGRRRSRRPHQRRARST